VQHNSPPSLLGSLAYSGLLVAACVALASAVVIPTVSVGNGGVGGFRISNIDVGTSVSPAEFLTGLKFVGAGNLELSVTLVPEPSTLALD